MREQLSSKASGDFSPNGKKKAFSHSLLNGNSDSVWSSDIRNFVGRYHGYPGGDKDGEDSRVSLCNSTEGRPKLRVLVADENADTRAAFCEVSDSLGLFACEAGSSKAARK